MNQLPANLPKPRSRLLRTLLKWPRNLRALAPRLSTEEALAQYPDPAETAHWGEVILLEDVTAVLHRDGTSSWLTHLITVPHGDANLAEWDEVIRVFDQSKSRLNVRRALVHTPDGRQHKAQRALVPIDAHNRALKLAFSPLRPGVAVEFEMQSDDFTPDETGPVMWVNFALQSPWPCRRRRLTVAIAEPFAAEINLHNSQTQPQKFQQGDYQVYRWDMHDVAAFESDMWTPPAMDFSPWIDISTLPDWKPVRQHYRKELSSPNGAPQAVKELARELTDGITNPRDKLMAVYHYAARDMRYGRHPSELEVATVRESTKMLEDLRGDCKDKSALMVQLLAEMNIPAKIAVLLTAMNGRTPMLPSRRFDHAIVTAELDGKQMWFDPAAGPFTFGDLPQNDQGVKALILDNDDVQFIDVPVDHPEQQQVQRLCAGQLNAQGDYTFRAKVTARGDRAAMYRITLQDRNEDHRRRTMQQAVADERPGAEVDEIDLGDVEDLQNEAKYGYRVAIPQWARPVQDLLLFHIPWAEPVEFSGPVSAAQRLSPLQMPNVMRLIERHEIQLPAGYQGYGLPWESSRKCQWAQYCQQVTCENGVLLCTRQMDTFGGIVPQDRFDEFKDFWEACARDDQADIVLVKQDGIAAG